MSVFLGIDIAEHKKNCELVDHAVDPKTKAWKDGSKVLEQIELMFESNSVVLYPDGTYLLKDWTGG